METKTRSTYKKIYGNYPDMKVECDVYKADCIEVKIEKLVSNKEPIGKDVPLRYTERKDGIIKDYDVRTDRFEVARDAMEKVHKTNIAKRDSKVVDFDEAKKNLEKSGETPANTSDSATK